MPSKTIALAAAGAAAFVLASCGGANAGTDTTAAANADADAARVRFAKCMRDNGVDIPDRPGQSGAAGPPRNIDREKLRAAQEKCDRYREQAFGNLTDAQRQEFRDAFAKFSACMRKQGVELPAPPAAGGSGASGAGATRRLQLSPSDQKAMDACRSNLPQGGRGGPGIVIGPGR